MILRYLFTSLLTKVLENYVGVAPNFTIGELFPYTGDVLTRVVLYFTNFVSCIKSSKHRHIANMFILLA
jgi:hypothetical protein